MTANKKWVLRRDSLAQSSRPLKLSAIATALSFAAIIAVGAGAAHAKGGTAKPPGGGGNPPPAGACPTGSPATSACIVPTSGPVLPNFPPAVAGALSANGANGFSITGHVQSVTVNGGCGAAVNAGGTVTVNSLVITVPSDSIIQYPANTLTWRDAVCGISTTNPPIALDGTGGTTAPVYPGVEVRIDGNITNSAGGVAASGTPYVAGIIHLSQQSLNSGAGYISSINYATGALVVTTPGGGTATLMINDPKGRYGRINTSTDARFSVDDANPTIKAGASGYPMCVPRSTSDPNAGGPDDPLCPQINRPRGAVGAAGVCRNFASAGIGFRIVGADLATTTNPQGFCAGFVMKARAGMPGTGGLVATQIAGPTDPDPRQQAPFEVGDYIVWSGTLVHTAGAAVSTDIIWVHTIDANVGIYTQPATLPAYVAVGENGFGVDPAPRTAVALVGVESTPRMVVEAFTTDVASVVDFYFDDKGFHKATAAEAAAAGCVSPCIAPDVPGGPASEYFRWLTPESMTGTLADQATQAARGVAIPASLTLQAGAFGGGIYTQFVGPQPGRARIRAIKVPAIDPALASGCPSAATIGGTRGCAVTQSPTRYIRAVLRSLCAPASSNAASEAGFAALATVPPSNLDNGAAGAAANTGNYFDVNGPRTDLPGAATGNFTGAAAGPGAVAVSKTGIGCFESAQYANGLFTGQYMAPVGGYIFPENTLAGFPVVPNNFWHLGFMAYGENGRDGNSTAQPVPRPW